MVEEGIHDPDRIATLLRAEIEGLEEEPFDALTVGMETDSTGSGEPAVTVRREEQLIFTATYGPNRLELEFCYRPDAVLEASSEAGLVARKKSSAPPATEMFVKRGADTKRVIDVLRTIHDTQ